MASQPSQEASKKQTSEEPHHDHHHHEHHHHGEEHHKHEHSEEHHKHHEHGEEHHKHHEHHHEHHEHEKHEHGEEHHKHHEHHQEHHENKQEQAAKPAEVKFGEGGRRNVHEACELRESPIAGHGVFATRDLPTGTLVWQNNDMNTDKAAVSYTWEQINNMEPTAKALIFNFGYQVDDDAFQGPISEEELKDDISNYWNHCCDPNTWIIDINHWALRRDVKAGEELNADYATFDTRFDRIPVCKCGKEACRGKVTPNDYLDPKLRARYGQHVMPYIAKRLAKLDEETAQQKPAQTEVEGSQWSHKDACVCKLHVHVAAPFPAIELL